MPAKTLAVSPRAKPGFVAFALLLPSTLCGQTVSISDPVADPRETWVTGNQTVISWSFTQGFSASRILIVNDADLSVEYGTWVGGAGSGNTTYNESIAVPIAGTIGSSVTCLVIVEVTYMGPGGVQKALKTVAVTITRL